MKRHFPLIGGMVVSLLVGSGLTQVSFAEQPAASSMVDHVLERHCTDIAQPAGENCLRQLYRNDHKEIRELAGADEPFKNLYLFLYQNLSEAPKEAALKYVAETEPNYTRAELERILEHNEVGLLHKVQMSDEEIAAEIAKLDALEAELQNLSAPSGISEGFVQNQAQQLFVDAQRRHLENIKDSDKIAWSLNEYGALFEKYQKELAFQRENRKLAYQAYASEIFFDNDLGNSANIDILHDLDLINFLLYGSFIEYPDREQPEVQLSSEDVILASETEMEAEPVDAYVCLEDESLRDALDTFESFVSEDGIFAEGAALGTLPDSVTRGPRLSDAEEAEALTKESFNEFLDGLSVAEGDWSRGLPCNEIFCITVNLVKGDFGTRAGGSSGEFAEQQNCVECHLDYIAGALSNTLQGGVHPNKVPQNWFEDGTCKEIGDDINLDFNVYAVPVPIELDPDDDTELFANSQVDNTVRALVEWSYLNNPNAFGKSPAQFEQEAYLNNLKYGGSKDLQESLQAVIDIKNQKETVLENLLTANAIEVKVQSANHLYDQMLGEFNSMHAYFQNFDDWIKTSANPINSIVNKPYCP